MSRDGRTSQSPCVWSVSTLGLAAALTVLGASCTSVGTEAPATAEPEAAAPSDPLENRTELQRSSLSTVFVAGGGQPPPLGEAERAALSSRKAAAHPDELEELEQYVRDPDLQLLAIRDTDGDGVHDYRISDYYGRFMEGDVDLDGDGVRNSLDVAPYHRDAGGADDDGDGEPDRNFDDEDSDGIPDHVDWSGRADDETATWQEELFRDYQVLLVGRSATPFPPVFARSARDALARIFREPLANGGLPTLRLIATDETCLLSPEVDDETNAMVVAQTQSLLAYRIGLDYPPIAQLGLLAHELAHSWQFSLDFDAEDLAAENRRVYNPSPNLHALVERFGWTADEFEYDPEVDDYTLFTPQYYVLGPEYRYRGKTPDEWKEMLTKLAEERGDSYLEDESARGIVGDYSLTSPAEWHADNLLAYLYISLEDRMNLTLDPQDAELLIGRMRAAAQDAWPGFRYQNFDREQLGDHYRTTFPILDVDLDYFIEEYLRADAAEGPGGRR